MKKILIGIFIGAVLVIAFSKQLSDLFSPHGGPLTKQYNLTVIEDKARVDKLEIDFNANHKKYCPLYAGLDLAGCILEYISKIKVESSMELTGYLSIISKTPTKDKALGESSERITSIVNRVDATLTLAENVNVSEFRIAKIVANDASEKSELKSLKKKDSKRLQKIRKSILDYLQDELKTLKSAPPQYVNDFHKEKIKNIGLRYEKFRSKTEE